MGKIALLVHLLSDVFVELVPGDFSLAESSHIVHHFLDIILSKVVLQLVRNPPQVLHLQHFLLLGVHQSKHSLASGLIERIADLISDQMEEGLEVHPLASQVLIDCAEGIEDELELSVEAQSASCVEDVGDITVSPVVAVEVEHLEEVLTVLLCEDRVLRHDLAGEDCLAVLLGELLPTLHHLNGYNLYIWRADGLY